MNCYLFVEIVKNNLVSFLLKQYLKSVKLVFIYCFSQLTHLQMFKHCETQGVLLLPEDQSAFIVQKSGIRLQCLMITAGQSGCSLLLKVVVLISLLCYNRCSSSYSGDQSWELTNWKLMALFISSGLRFNCISFLVQPVCSYCFLHRLWQ